jgi:hypothetical protein
VAEEELIEAQVLATAAWVRAYGEFLISPNSNSPSFLSWIFLWDFMVHTAGGAARDVS